MTFYKDICTGGGDSNHTFQGLLDTGSKLTLIPRDLKQYCGSPVKQGAYASQVLNGILALVHLQWVQRVPKLILWLFPQFQNF